MKVNTIGCLFVLSTVLVSGCGSTSETEDGPVIARSSPFRVGVAPVRVNTVQFVADSTLGSDEDGATQLRLALDAAEMTRLLAEDLRQSVFADVVQLDFPVGLDRAEFESKVHLEQDQLWFRLGRERNADVVLISDVTVEPIVSTNTNGNFWWNIPVFLFAGPVSYLIDDRDYSANVRLDGSLFDLSSIGALSSEEVIPRKRIAAATSRFESEDLNFLDRADLTDDIDSFALTLLLPPGLFAVETGSTLVSLTEEAIGQLCRQLGLELQDRREEAIEAKEVIPFWIDVDKTTAVYADGSINVISEAVLVRKAGPEALYGYRLSVDGESIAGGVFSGTSPARSANVLRYPIRAAGRVLPGVRTVRLTLIDGSPDQMERSFTLPVTTSSVAGG